MENTPALDQITIRTELRIGDLGYVASLHGRLYAAEYGYGLPFEAYVCKGLAEFYERYDPARSRAWICEVAGRMVGCLFLLERGEAAQLRYFLIEPEYRGIGLGAKLMGLCMDFLRGAGYRQAYLWTTSELDAAAFLYRRAGFRLTEEKESTAFGKPVVEQRYDLAIQ